MQIMKFFVNNEIFRRELAEHAGGGRKSETFIPMALVDVIESLAESQLKNSRLLKKAENYVN